MRIPLVRLLGIILFSLLWLVPAQTHAAAERQESAQMDARIWLPMAFNGQHSAQPSGTNGELAPDGEPGGESLNLSLEFDGRERTFILFLPDAYAPGVRLPLALNLHGAGSTGAGQQAYTGFDAVANANDMLVAYPDGVGRTWAALGVNSETLDDVGFLVALVDYVDEEFGIDQRRIYSFGLSQGGFMSFRLACERPDRFAAIGSVAGLMYNGVFTDCAPSRPVPVMLVHGTADPVVPYAGTEIFPGVHDVLWAWRTYNGCQPPPGVYPVPDVVPTDASTVVQFFTQACARDSQIVFFRVNNGGHTWPGATINLPVVGPTNRDIDANTEFAAFFLRHELPE